ncbi:MAG TPA: NAD(P)-dependent glycerol-1-phosphate dehydrogenase [Candidatus Thermoplasmatota archaeon]|nr:NAD(P)-dependent glycerol-1-phosphate dehydrogenase [Candidatus Thermoplasmatota archaeon]
MGEFRKSKLMVFPRHVLVGHGVLSEAGTLCSNVELHGTALLVAGPRTRKIAGDAVEQSLSASGVKVVHEAAASASLSEVEAVEKRARKEAATFVVGVGGGSVIDVAKLGAHRARLPFVSVPTSASHDGITSPRASIKDAGTPSSIEASMPAAILADTGVIAQAPYRMLASGCADAISNETAVLDWKLAHRLRGEEYSSFAAALAETAAEIILENAEVIKPGLEEAAWVVVKGLIVSGVSMSVAGSSRPASGAEHMISHTLDRLAPGQALHGEQCGVASIVTMYLHGGDWERIRDSLSSIGAPTTSKALGIPKETMVEALVRAHEIRRDRYTILGDNGLTREAASRLLHVTGVSP